MALGNSCDVVMAAARLLIRNEARDDTPSLAPYARRPGIVTAQEILPAALPE